MAYKGGKADELKGVSGVVNNDEKDAIPISKRRLLE